MSVPGAWLGMLLLLRYLFSSPTINLSRVVVYPWIESLIVRVFLLLNGSLGAWHYALLSGWLDVFLAPSTSLHARHEVLQNI